MKFSITADSQTGCVRKKNEDMVLVGDKYIRNANFWTMIDIPAQDRFIIALADGMGGHAGGEVASSDVLHNLHYFIHDLPSGLHASDINEHLYEWLQSMNNIVDSKGHSDPAFKDMGTTLVAQAKIGRASCRERV